MKKLPWSGSGFAARNVADTEEAIGAFSHGIYQLDDGTGVIWVYFCSRGALSKGARVGVRGRIMPMITFLGINYATVLQESDAGDRAKMGSSTYFTIFACQKW